MKKHKNTKSILPESCTVSEFKAELKKIATGKSTPENRERFADLYNWGKQAQKIH